MKCIFSFAHFYKSLLYQIINKSFYIYKKSLLMQEGLKKILATFHIVDDEDITQAIQSLHSRDKWQKFIQENIPSHLHQKINQEIKKMLEFTTNTQESNLEKIYHELQQIDIDISKINVLNLSQFKWSKDLANSIAESMREKIDHNLQHNKTINQFFRESVQTIFDLMSRKGDLKEYFNFVKISNEQFKNKSRLNNIIKEITFTDFIILLIKSVKQKELIGQLLNTLAVPIPLLLEVDEKMVFHRNICKSIFGQGLEKYSLILNIGSQKTSKCGKTSFISKLMSLEQKNQGNSFFNNTLNSFTKLSFTKAQKTVLLDFNGVFSKKLNPDILQMIINLASHTSLLIIHLNELEAIEKLLDTIQYKRLCSKPQKILIYIRDTQKIGLKKLNKSIPVDIHHKTMLRALQNLSKIQEPIEHIKQINQIISKSYNILNPQFSMKVLYDQNERQQLSQQSEMVAKAISQIYEKDYSRKSIIPNVCKIEELLQVSSEIKESNSIQKLKYFTQKQRVLNFQLKKPQITQFIRNTLKIIEREGSQQIFLQKLYQWKKQNTEPLIEEYLKLTQQLSLKQNQKTSQKIHTNEEKRRNFEISIDKIICELILYNKIYKNQEYSSIISQFYDANMKKLSPINLIDGKTLLFGNEVLQEQIIKLSKSYQEKNKKIYVVSVIGAQSSAKSTLLNFLFRCRFQTSAGRCTKGVYMSLCQIEDIVIIVLDTQGLLSVTERDVAFDHQIATFVLKISDLIIINNKGQLTSTLKQMLEVCLYVLQCLHIDQQKTEYSPHKIIFALRDQTQPKGKFQEQMAAQIKYSLEQMINSSNLDYKNFFNIEAQDILSFPNAFIENPGLVPQLPTITLNNKTFQKCIIGMRKRIFDCLRSSPSKSNLIQIYNQASRTWQTIQKCGKQIMNYKSVNEIVTKTRLWETFQSKVDEYTTIIEKDYDSFFEKINSIDSSFELQQQYHKQEISQIFNRNYKRLCDDFLTRCSQICSNRQWIKSCLPKIKRLCSSYESSNTEKYFKKIRKLKNSEKNGDLKNKLNQIINRLIKQNFPSQVAIKKFRQSAMSIMSDLRKTKENICKQKLNFQIKNVFQNILSFRNNNKQKLIINHIQDCQSYYRSINEHKQLLKLFNISYKRLLQEKDEKAIRSILKNINQFLQKKVRQYLKNKNIILPSQLQTSVYKLQIIISNGQSQFQNQINNLNNSFFFMKILLNDYKLRMYLFGKVYIIVKDYIYKSNLQAIDRENSKIEKNIQKYEESLKKIIQNKGNFQKMLKDDFFQFQKAVISKNIDQFENILIEGVDKLSQRLMPESIFSKAMQQTLLKRDFTDKKQHYIQCFKLVKNFNQYLFQIMCKQPQISTRSAAISDAISKAIQDTKKTVDEFGENLQTNLSLQKSHQLKQLLIKSNMIGLASMQSEQFNLKLICQSLLITLKERRDQIIDNMVKQLKQQDSQSFIIQYIEGDLKDKIIGCQSRCPICSMKCMLNSLHQEGHHVLHNCHSLSAFGGCRYIQSQEPVLNVCQQKVNMQCRWLSGERQFQNLKVFIEENYPMWSEDFPLITESSKFQKFTDIINLKQIWSNIEKAIINAKKFSMKCSTSKQIELLRDQGILTEEDLNIEYERPLTGNKYRLRNY